MLFIFLINFLWAEKLKTNVCIHHNCNFCSKYLIYSGSAYNFTTHLQLFGENSATRLLKNMAKVINTDLHIRDSCKFIFIDT